MSIIKKIHAIPNFVKILLLVDLLLIALFLIDHSFGSPFDFLEDFLDVDDENNLPAWYSSMQLFLVSLTMGIFCAAKINRKEKSTWILLIFPITFLLMSLDEIAMIHEELGEVSDFLLEGGRRRNTPFRVTGIWMFLLGIPFFIAMLSLILVQLRKYIMDFPNITRKFVLGLSVYVFSAAGIEIFSNYYRRGSPYLIQVCAEEFGEMLGITILLWATLDLLKAHKIKIDLNRKE
ncbi:MAG: hypothetical protein HQ509_04660 [Candidatus Marinimicrobia bacterium]|nr:hypothetical protein [Candidatus Neomarinimicrobiota bacterium]